MQYKLLGEISSKQLKLYWIKVELQVYWKIPMWEYSEGEKEIGFKKLQESNIREHGTKGTSLVQNQRLCTCVNITPHTGEKKKQKNKRPTRAEGKVSQFRLKPHEYRQLCIFGDGGDIPINWAGSRWCSAKVWAHCDGHVPPAHPDDLPTLGVLAFIGQGTPPCWKAAKSWAPGSCETLCTGLDYNTPFERFEKTVT